MNIGLIAFTSKGCTLGESLCPLLQSQGHQTDLFRCRKDTLADWTNKHFNSDHALLFIGAAGIAVRSIAPFIKSKTSDPAVLVIDELGRYVIPLLSGHIGGANRMAQDIAKMLDAIPVITTATDCNGVFAVDTWASENKISIINPERIKWVSARLLAGEKIKVKSHFPIEGELPDGISVGNDEYDVLLTIKTRGRNDALRLVPPILTLGVGCRKGISAEDLDLAFELLLKKKSCYKEAVCRVCSIDLKSNEKGLLNFCKVHGLLLQTFSAAQLNAVKGCFTSSEFVLKTTGVDNVCERSAVLGSGGELLVMKHAGNGITMALAISPYKVKFLEESKLV